MENKMEEYLKKLADKMPEPECELLYTDKVIKIPVQRKMHALSKAVAIIVVVGIASFGTVFVSNAEFRETMIQFFKVDSVEEVPNDLESQKATDSISDFKQDSEDAKKASGEKIILYETGNIEDVFFAEYLEADCFMEPYGNGLFYYKNEEGTKEMYQAVADKFVPLGLQRVYQKVSLFGIAGTIDYSYCKVGETVSLCENNTDKIVLDEDREAFYSLEWGEDKKIYLKLNINPQSDCWSYPLNYNIESGEIVDFLANVEIKETKLSDFSILTNWYLGRDYVIVTAGKNEKDKEVYWIDVKNKMVSSINELTGLDRINSYKVIEDKLFLLCGELDMFDYIRYDITSGEQKTVYEDISYWAPGSSEKVDKVHFTGGRYDLVQKAGIIYLSDELSGELKEVEGITSELAQSAMINNEGNKMLVCSVANSSIQQLGMIDISSNSFYLMERRNDSKVEEYSIGWNDDKQVAIVAEDRDNSKYYVYLYSLKK